jgi:hypothetical protein
VNVAHASTEVASSTARDAIVTLEWSSMMLKIFTTPRAVTHSVASICHRSFGAAASKQRHDDFGRFLGCGSTSARRTRTRCTPATDGTGFSPERPRCHWIVVAP